jgi:predicted DNA-binding transcriptional regulator AlpA
MNLGDHRIVECGGAGGLAMETNSNSKCPTCSGDSIEIMTAKDVALFLKISVKTVYSYANRKMLPTYWKFQNNVRFEKRQIIEWMKEHNQAIQIKSRGRVA